VTRRGAVLLAVVVFIADQLSKWWIIDGLGLRARGSVPVLPFFSLTWVENYGVSMGLLQAGTGIGRWLLVALTAGIAAMVAWWIRRERGGWELAALGLVLGGALGNIVDRIRFGYVVDFVHLHAVLFGRERSFYVFNVADAAISVGVAVLLARALLAPKEKTA
jgi:signal peptidase II